MNRLILDKNHSDALICAMYEAKKIIYEPSSKLDETMFNNALKEYKRKGIKKKTLIYALLYDQLELVDPCIEVKNEIIYTSHRPVLNDFDAECFKNATDIMDISLTSISKYRDLLSQEEEWFSLYKQVQNKNRKLFNYVNQCFYKAACLFMIGEIDSAFLQIPDFLKEGLSQEEIINLFRQELENIELSPFSATLFMYMFWINEITYMMKLSSKKEMPFVTNQINLSRIWSAKKNCSDAKDILDVYERCIVIMKQELQYIPQVNTFDDVLRIREKKEFIRFKEVINKWVSLMSNNEVDLASRMQADIVKANKELKRYCEYKDKATSFFFWFPIVSSFIPIVPGVVWWGIENAVKKAIDHQICKYNWVGIGNP